MNWWKLKLDVFLCKASSRFPSLKRTFSSLTKYKLRVQVKPELATTSEQRPPVYNNQPEPQFSIFDSNVFRNSSRLDTEMVHEVQPNSAERESESEGKGGLES
jgi:hypothetical protein